MSGPWPWRERENWGGGGEDCEKRKNCGRDEIIIGEEICADNGVLVERIKNCGKYRELLENQSFVEGWGNCGKEQKM